MQPYIQSDSELNFYVITEEADPVKLNSVSLVGAFREAIAKGYNVNRKTYVDGKGSERRVFFSI